MMVGRAIEDIYPPLPPHTNQTVFAAEKLSSAGVFEDISFEIHAGEIFGFAGMMGAGRSEVARSIFGMDPYDSGKIFIDGKERKFHSIREAIRGGVAMITEDRGAYGFVGVRSIEDNIALRILTFWLQTAG